MIVKLTYRDSTDNTQHVRICPNLPDAKQKIKLLRSLGRYYDFKMKVVKYD